MRRRNDGIARRFFVSSFIRVVLVLGLKRTFHLLATYSNLENHPRLIRARQTNPVPKIQLNPRTGLPTTSEQPEDEEESDNEEDADSDDTIGKRTAIVWKPS